MISDSPLENGPAPDKNGEAPVPSLKPVPPAGYYKASWAQKRFYIIDRQFGEGNTVYNTPQAVIVRGNFDRERAAFACHRLIERHETLRTSFSLMGGEPVQHVHPAVEFAIAYDEATEAELDQVVHKHIKPFDISRAPLFRVGLIRVSPEKHLLIFDMHHIISDDISLFIIVRDFFSLYQGKSLPGLPVQYKDFAAWQNELFQAGLVQRQEEYWLNVFRGEIPLLDLPVDYPRQTVQSYEGERVTFIIDAALTGGLHQLAAETGTTLYEVLLASYYVLLAKLTGQDDIVVGVITAGRPAPGLENIIGAFANMMALRNHPEVHKRFREFLMEIKDCLTKSYQNQGYHFEKLVDKLGVKRNLSRNPLFDTMFLMSYFKTPQIDTGDLTISSYEFDIGSSKLDVRLIMAEMGQEIQGIIDYRTSLFAPETIARMIRDYLQILKAIIASKDVCIGAIEPDVPPVRFEKALLKDVSFDF